MVKRIKNFSIAGLIPAGGLGKRLGLGPKAFLEINKKSLLKIVVSNLSGVVDRILVGVPSDYIERAREEIGYISEVYKGGRSRQETIKLLFERTEEEIILIHDVVRPFASRELFKKVIEGAKKYGACGTFISSHLPVFLFEDDFVISSISSKKVLHPQSPQAFRREILEKAFKFAEENEIEEQTIYELISRMGIKIYIVEGDETNIKITIPLDFEVAKKIIPKFIKNKGRRNGD